MDQLEIFFVQKSLIFLQPVESKHRATITEYVMIHAHVRCIHSEIGKGCQLLE